MPIADSKVIQRIWDEAAPKLRELMRLGGELVALRQKAVDQDIATKIKNWPDDANGFLVGTKVKRAWLTKLNDIISDLETLLVNRDADLTEQKDADVRRS